MDRDAHPRAVSGRWVRIFCLFKSILYSNADTSHIRILSSDSCQQNALDDADRRAQIDS